MTYDQQILKVLTEAGEGGVSVQAIAKHVYNMNCTFFFQPDYEEIRTYVQQYLLRNSKSAQSIIESTGRRGYYRLNTEGSADARQMMLQFREERVEEKKRRSPNRTSPSVFSINLLHHPSNILHLTHLPCRDTSHDTVVGYVFRDDSTSGYHHMLTDRHTR